MSKLKLPVDFFLRYFAFVQRALGDDNACWIWQGRATRQGYGVIRYAGKLEMAHRMSYRMFKGPIPPKREVDHLCRNKLCVNPQHLQAVPSAVNTRRGKRAKLTGAQVREIRTRYVQGVITQTALAREYGVHPAHISRLVNRELWTKMHARFERI